MTRKILLSVLVIGALLVAVAGITRAVFSDNISSDDQVFTAGTVDIQVDDEDSFFNTILDMPNMEPGDCSTQTVTVSNVGSLPINLWNWIYTWGDIFGCDPNASCNMNVTKTFHSEDAAADGAEFIAPGGWEKWTLDACLPLCAGNNCQAKSGTMRMFFHAVQESNLDGFECVKLEDKASPDWIPNPVTPAHGNVCYKVDGAGDLRIILNAYGLNPDKNFQLALDGGDTNDAYDADCQAQDGLLAGMSGDIYIAGYWNWGTYLEASCTVGSGGEGVWNYAGVYTAVKSDATGAISYDATLNLPTHTGYIVKANVKEVTGTLPGTAWTGVLSGLDYLRFNIP